MSLMVNAVRLLARALPDCKPDPLLHANTVIGNPFSRIDGEAKVTGTAPFTADLALTGMAYTALVCSDVPAGRITVIDTAAARKRTGVLLHDNTGTRHL
jgi:hypothetical protein